MNLLFKHEVRYMFKHGGYEPGTFVKNPGGFSVVTRRASEVPLTLSYRKMRSGAAIVEADEDGYKWHFDYK